MIKKAMGGCPAGGDLFFRQIWRKWSFGYTFGEAKIAWCRDLGRYFWLGAGSECFTGATDRHGRGQNIRHGRWLYRQRIRDSCLRHKPPMTNVARAKAYSIFKISKCLLKRLKIICVLSSLNKHLKGNICSITILIFFKLLIIKCYR